MVLETYGRHAGDIFQIDQQNIELDNRTSQTHHDMLIEV
jgi:hypothetical protein